MPRTVEPPRVSERLLAFVEREALLIGLVAFYVVVLVIVLPQELVQDSWLTLVSGREVAQHGLPAHDHLTVWTRGAPWIDQQWLAQLAFYGLYVLGGIKLALMVHVALLTAAFVSALAAARHRGASQRSVLLVAVVCMFLAPWALQMRAQSFAELLFVWLLWLLVADSRAPSRRVFLVLPILALWANLHGTVVMGTALVALRGFTDLRRSPLRATGLTAGAVAALVASPYGFSLVGYYHKLLMNPMLHWFINEWNSSAPSRKTAIFFVLSSATIWLLARYGKRLTLFENGALLFTMLAGLLAVRSIIWFALAALVVLPFALDQAMTSVRGPARGRIRLAVAGVALVAVLASAGVAAAQPTTWYTSEWPSRAARVVATSAAHDSSARVLSDDRYADWLLWMAPQLAGRVAYDVRFELFTEPQLVRLFHYRNQIGDNWMDAGRGYRLIALDRPAENSIIRSLLAEKGARLLYQDKAISVVERP